jgi:hypothetical protein
MHTVIPTTYPESHFPSAFGGRTERWGFRVAMFFLVVCSCVSETRAGCTHAQPIGWYSQQRSDLPESIKAAANARWGGLFEVVYEGGEFVYVTGASDHQSRLPRCGQDSEESLGQLALHFGSSRPNLAQALPCWTSHKVHRPNSRYPSELSLGQLLDGHLQLPEHPPRF